jgi:succinate--hydroxymethylglutarate CoA-transferase
VTGREPRSGHPSLVPSQLFRTADGWIFIMCNKEKFWPILAKELGIEDPRFSSFEKRLKNKAEVTARIEKELSKGTTANWLKKLAGKVPAAPVTDVKHALDNPFVAERGGIADFSYADGRTARLVAGPIRCGAELPKRAAPTLGADTDALLRELGYAPEKVAELRDLKVVG